MEESLSKKTPQQQNMAVNIIKLFISSRVVTTTRPKKFSLSLLQSFLQEGAERERESNFLWPWCHLTSYNKLIILY